MDCFSVKGGDEGMKHKHNQSSVVLSATTVLNMNQALSCGREGLNLKKKANRPRCKVNVDRVMKYRGMMRQMLEAQ